MSPRQFFYDIIHRNVLGKDFTVIRACSETRVVKTWVRMYVPRHCLISFLDREHREKTLATALHDNIS